MRNLASTLNCRIDVHAKTPTKNVLGETTFNYPKTKSVWAEIIPSGGTQKDGQGGMVYAEITHRIIIRAGAIPDLANDMYFMFKGQRYNIKYFFPNYRLRDRVEIYCSLVVGK